MLTFRELPPHAKMVFEMSAMLIISAIHPELAASQATSWALSFALSTTLQSRDGCSIFADEGLNLTKVGWGQRCMATEPNLKVIFKDFNCTFK